MKRSRQLTVLGILLVSGAILLGGCGGGGGDRLSKDEYASKANALCAAVNKKTDALSEPNSAAEIIAGLNELLPAQREMVAKLKKLSPPVDEEVTAKRAIALSEEITTREEEMNTALKNDDMAQAVKLATAMDAPSNKADALFRQLGATECAVVGEG